MLLVCGNAGDPLIDAIHDLDQRGESAIRSCSEAELFGSIGLALELDRESVCGRLQIENESVAFTELDGIVLRLPRTWWPEDGFDLQDQMFVYHETLATWFALLQSIRCPVVNRFGLGWWLQDLGYPMELQTSLGEAIHLSLAEPEYNNNLIHGRLVSTRRSSANSVYRAGGETFAVPECNREILKYLAHHGQELQRWEENSGIILSRLDFDTSGDLRLTGVEASPLFNEEDPELVKKVAGALLQCMIRHQEVPA